MLRVGDGFEGCLLEGPNFIFNSSLNQAYKVVWGHCPLNSQSCMYLSYLIIYVPNVYLILLTINLQVQALITVHMPLV